MRGYRIASSQEIFVLMICQVNAVGAPKVTNSGQINPSITFGVSFVLESAVSSKTAAKSLRRVVATRLFR